LAFPQASAALTRLPRNRGGSYGEIVARLPKCGSERRVNAARVLLDSRSNTERPLAALHLDSDDVIHHDQAMAKEKVYSEVLNVRVDEAMSNEIKRIANQGGSADSETARMLIEWGIEAHRAREVAKLKLRYDVDAPHDRHGDPLVLTVEARWVPADDWEDS
jgi:hypothetical protein